MRSLEIASDTRAGRLARVKFCNAVVGRFSLVVGKTSGLKGPTTKDQRRIYEHIYREYFCSTSERAPGKDRGADDGLQTGPERIQGRHGTGSGVAAQERRFRGGEEVGSRYQRRFGGQLHPCRRKDRRAG